MLLLSLTVFAVVLVSAICSTMEAALYSLPWTHIETLRTKGVKTGNLLYQMKSQIDRPIAAILTLNTVANTAGATVSGAIATNVLDPYWLPWFAGFLTLLILAFGEIVPKTLGVVHSKSFSMIMARPLQVLVFVFKPFIWLSSVFTRVLTQKKNSPSATEEDIRAITTLSRESGGIQPYEESAIRNILALDAKRIHEIMTPRTIVFSLQEKTTVNEAYTHPQIWNYSRIPVYGEDNEDIVGIVLRKEIGHYMTLSKGDITLGDIMQPVRFVLESQTVDKVLLEFLESRLHLFIVLDEYGGLAGVVSLEDVLEELLGHEIVDESDAVVDLRQLARERRNKFIQHREEDTADVKF